IAVLRQVLFPGSDALGVVWACVPALSHGSRCAPSQRNLQRGLALSQGCLIGAREVIEAANGWPADLEDRALRTALGYGRNTISDLARVDHLEDDTARQDQHW